MEPDKKQLKKLHFWIRGIIQLVFFIFIPSAYTAAFNGAKYIFTQLGNSAVLERTSFVSAMIVLCIYTLLFGRFFCGFACTFGSFGDWVNVLYIKICKKLKRRPIKLKKTMARKMTYLKYLVLVIILYMCFTGKYGMVKGSSPWDVFSMIRVMNIRLSGYTVGIVLLLLIITGMCIQERFFCRFLCPMGAIFAILPVLPFFVLQRNRENCIKGCRACTNICPSGIELPAEGIGEVRGDCFQCQKCIDICPKGNVRTSFSRLKGNEIIFTVIRALILFALMKWIGI